MRPVEVPEERRQGRKWNLRPWLEKYRAGERDPFVTGLAR
jgi:hypothetical protein